MKDYITISLLFFCIPAFLTAQQKTKDSITALQEVVIVEELKTKHAAGIISSEIIGAKVFQNYSPIDVSSAINQIPGVFILSGALNTNRITIRGVGARTLYGTDKLRLYFNDIPITNGSGFSSIEAYDLENLSQMEVVKGPKATSYGTNLGGAIILNSKEAIGKSTSFGTNFTLGSYHLVKNNFSFSHADENLSLGVAYNHLKTDGYRENNNFERDGVLITSSYAINSNNRIGLLINYIDYQAQIPSSLGLTDFNENPQKAAFTWKEAQGFEANAYTLLGLTYGHDFSQKFKNTTSIFYSYLDHYEPRPFGILDEFTNGFGFRTRFNGEIDLLDHSATYSFGAELYKDEYNWREFENLYQQHNGNGSLQGNLFAENKEFRTQWNTFGSINVALSASFNAQLGLNLNQTQYHFKDLFNEGADNKSAAKVFKTIVNPSLNLSYSFSEIQQLYANISRGFSNPSLEETLTPDGVINPDIRQETGINYELGANFYAAHQKLHFSMAIYQMNIKNLLVAARVAEDQYIGKNAGKTKHQGFEIASDYLLYASAKLKITPFVNYTFSHHNFVEFSDADANFSGNELTGVPKHRINSGIQAQFFDDFHWVLTHQYVAAIPLNDANSLYSDPYTLFGTKISYQKKVTQQFTIGASFGINNLFDRNYAQSVLINAQGFGSAEPRFYYPGNNRNYYSSLNLRYML